MITYFIARIRYFLVRLCIQTLRLYKRIQLTYWLTYWGDPVSAAWRLSESLWPLAVGFSAYSVVISHLEARYAPVDSLLKQAMQRMAQDLTSVEGDTCSKQ